MLAQSLHRNPPRMTTKGSGMRGRAIRIGLVTVLAIALAACGSSAKAPSQSASGDTSGARGKIGLSEFFLKDLGQSEIKKSFEQAAKGAGYSVITTDANNDPGQQLADVENLISQNVKAIAINPVDSAAIVPGIEKAVAAGIKVFTIDRVPTGGKVSLTVRTDNATLGKLAGQRVAELLKAKSGSESGNVLQITGDLTSTNAQDRESGFDAVMKQYPDIKVITREAKGWDPQKGADIAQQIIGAGSPKIDAVYFHSDFTGAGIVPAMAQAGQTPVGEKNHIIVVGIDGSTQGLGWVKSGDLDAEVSQPLSDFGSVVFKYGIVPILAGKTLQAGAVPEEGAIWSPATLVTTTQPGPVILLAPSLVTRDNVGDARLWGNQK